MRGCRDGNGLGIGGGGQMEDMGLELTICNVIIRTRSAILFSVRTKI